MRNLLLLLLLCSQLGYSQSISVNTDGSTADASAIFDLKSTSKGFLAPRLTTSQRGNISSPANGLLVYDTDTNSFWYFESSAWTELGQGDLTLITDGDDDTKIEVEQSSDSDEIRFSVAGNEELVLDSEGKLGLGTDPSELLHVKSDPIDAALETVASATSSNTGLYGTTTIWQSFTPNNSGDLATISIRTNGSPTTSGTLSIYSGAGNGGTLLGSQSFSLSGVANNWANYDVSGLGITLTVGQVYTFEFGSMTDRLGHVANSSNPHSGGNYYSNIYGNLSGYDMLFQVVVGTPAEPAYDFVVSTGGKVGIRTDNPSYALHVNGSAAGTNGFSNLSDQRYKKDIETINDATTMLQQIRGVRFDWRQAEFPKLDFGSGTEIGFIAQELLPVFPEVVNQDKDGYYSVEYANLVPVLVEAVKELTARLDVNEQIIRQLNTQLASKKQSSNTSSASTQTVGYE